MCFLCAFIELVLIHFLGPAQHVFCDCSSVRDMCEIDSFMFQLQTPQQYYKGAEFFSTLKWKRQCFGLKEHSLQTIQSSQHEVSIAFVTYHERLFTPTERCSTAGETGSPEQHFALEVKSIQARLLSMKRVFLMTYGFMFWKEGCVLYWQFKPTLSLDDGPVLTVWGPQLKELIGLCNECGSVY